MMYQQVEKLYLLLNYLDDALHQSRKQKGVTVEQSLKIDKDIILSDHAQLNINNQQIQNVIIFQSKEWISEAKEIAGELLKFIPGPNVPLPDAVRQFKRNAVDMALVKCNGKKIDSANSLGIESRALKYIMSGK